jgi:hypothetical protein
VWQNVSVGHTEINILSLIIEKFKSNCVCMFLFQYIDNDETLEKLCWTQNVFHLCQVENIFGMRAHIVSFAEDECR